MGLASEQSSIAYTGTASALTEYAFPFDCRADDHVKVSTLEDFADYDFDDPDDVIAAHRAEVEMDSDDFVVTRDTETGTGHVVLDAAPGITTRVTVFRRVPLTQLLELPSHGAMPSASIEERFDLLVMALQDMNRGVQTALGSTDGTGFVAGSPVSTIKQTKTWADSTARGALAPDFTGQLGTQQDDDSAWVSTGTSAGNWTLAYTPPDELPVGTIIHSMQSSITGWLLLDGSTIGDASSLAGRPNADTEDLFTLLWTNLSDDTAPLLTSAGASSTRGANAAADWAAHKRLTLPDAHGRALACRDFDTNVLTQWVSNVGAVDELGAKGGLAGHVITAGQMAAHTHSITYASGLKMIKDDASGAPVDEDGTDGYSLQDGPSVTGSVGTNTAHNNVQPTLLVNTFIKL